MSHFQQDSKALESVQCGPKLILFCLLQLQNSLFASFSLSSIEPQIAVSAQDIHPYEDKTTPAQSIKDSGAIAIVLEGRCHQHVPSL